MEKAILLTIAALHGHGHGNGLGVPAPRRQEV
jgi:hypothetical protein